MSPRPSRTQVRGTARIGHRTKDLVKRLRRGDIAVIDHHDLDRVAAESLLSRGIVAVVNAASSISGRYPNDGPLRIIDSGVLIVDACGREVMDRIVDGATLELDDGQLRVGGEQVGHGTVLDRATVVAEMERARLGIGDELRSFAVNTLEYVEREADLTFEPIVLPPLGVDVCDRHALVVVRGHDYQADLAALRPYLREYRPVMIGVDGGADALVELGIRPDLIIGDFDSVSQRALRSGAELIHHVHPDGRAPGRENLVEWGVPYEEFVVEGTSEDAAMLLAYEAGARLIVAVGTHATMVEFLDKGRPGMASTFLTRLRLGSMLVDAKGVHRLYEGRARRSDLLLLLVAALVPVLVMILVSEPLQVFLDGLRLTVRDWWDSVF